MLGVFQRSFAAWFSRPVFVSSLLALVLVSAPASAADDDGFETLAGLLASEASSAASDAVSKKVESAQEAAVEAVKGDIESRVIYAIARKKGMDSAVAIERAYDGLMEQIDFINEKIEVIDYAVEKYTKFANGEYSDLAVDLWKEAVNKVASSEVATELFKQIGISSNVVSLAVRALEITADSYLELHKRTAEARLESLYGAIEQDKRLFMGKKSGRELGSGNPIPVSREAVDIVYKRIAEETGFRERFKIYVEQELNATFPTPDFFDSMLIAVQTGGGAAAGSAVANETQRALAKNKDDIESWIRALLAQLNSHAKLREAAFVAEKQLREIQRARASLVAMKSRIASLRSSAASAAKKIPEMRAFLAEIPGRISEAKKAKDDARVRAGRARIKEYMLGDVAALPASAERTALVADFRAGWRSLSAAIKEIGSMAEAQMKADASKAVDALGPSAAYAFGSFGSAFNLTVDDLRGPMAQAKTVADLDKAVSAASERLDKEYEAFSRAFDRWQTDLDKSVSAALKPYTDAWMKSPPQISETEMRNQGGLASAARNKVWIPAYVQYQLAEKRRSALIEELSELHRTLRAPFEADGRGVVQATERLEQNYYKLVNGARGASELFDSLKGISYAGLPQLNPPKWDASRPEKLLGYLYTLRSNILNEKQAVEQAKARYASAEELVRGLKEGKAVADAIRSETGGVRQRAAALKMTDQESALGRIEQGLAEYDKLLARAAKINFRQVSDEASAPDTEMAYINGLINQVETIARLLERYALTSLRRGDAIVQVPVLRNVGDTAGVVVTPAQLLTTQQVAQLPAQLHAAVDKVGFSGFDQKANVGLRQFIDNEMTRFRAAYTAPAYGIVEGQLVTTADLDALAGEIAKIAPTQSDFNRKIYDTVRAPAFARFEMSASYEGNTGATKVDFGRLAKLTGDSIVTGAGRKLIDAITRKVADNKAYLDEQNRKLAEENRKMRECTDSRGVWANNTCNMISATGGLSSPSGVPQSGAPSSPAGGTSALAKPATQAPNQAPFGGPGSPAGGGAAKPPGVAPVVQSAFGGPSAPAQGASSATPASAGTPGAQVFTPPAAGSVANAPAPAAMGFGVSASAAPPAVAAPSSAARPAQSLSVQSPLGVPATAASTQSPFGGPGAPTGASVPRQAGVAPAMQSPFGAALPPQGAPAAAPAATGSPGGQATIPASASSVANAPAPAAMGFGTQSPAAPPASPGSSTVRPAQSAPMQSPFGGASAAAPMQSPFGGPSAPSAQPAAAARPSASAPSPFGGQPAPAAQIAIAPAQSATPTVPGRQGAGSSGPAATGLGAAAGGGPATLALAAPVPGPAAAPAGPDPMQQIREMYQRFAEAYQRKDVRGVMKYISNDWKAADGASAPELEDTLSNSFRVFDTIQFQVQGLQIQKSGNDYRVSYQTSLTGRNLKRNLTHQDKASITDTVVIGTDGPKIIRTTGGSLVAK